MSVRASTQKALAWTKEHGGFVSLVLTTVGGTALVAQQFQGLKKDLLYERELRNEELEHERQLRNELQQRTAMALEHERQLRNELQQRTDLLVKNKLFDILHHSDYEAAARALHRSEASPSAHPSTD